MFKNKIIKWIAVLVFVLAAFYSLTMNKNNYNDEVSDGREGYIESLHEMEQSPISHVEDLEDFNYFEIDENWRIRAEFIEDPSDKHFPMTMTDGSIEGIKMAGYANFEVNGVKCRVMLFDEGETFLLPFSDETNGEETYGGGRYLNVIKTNNNRLEIDFNLAHNFYCVYNVNFVCPIPPTENHLNVNIEAGEKMIELDNEI